jgi:cell division septation protein DedD
MSDDQPVIEAAPEEAPAEQVYACPVSADLLPPQYRKHVDPKAPVPIRSMAAKGLVPLSPSDMITVLFMLMYDPEASVRDSAGKTASTLPDRIAASAFRDEQVPAPVLGWYLTLYATNEAYAEMLILNGNTPDDAVAAIAASCSQRTAEIVAQNQLRLLRHENILRELAKNPVAQGALIDGVCDFAVRNGLVLADVPQMQEARIRLYGPEVIAKPPPPEGPSADDVMEEFGMAADAEAEAAAAPMEEGKKLTLSQRIMKMNVAEKIKLATKGNKEARGILIRDSNKLVAVAVIRSPRITDGEVLAQAQNKVAHDDVLRVIYSNREWLRKYAIKLALVKNPKVPQGVAMRLLNQLHEADVKGLAKDKNVSSNIQMLAKKQLDKKGPRKES